MEGADLCDIYKLDNDGLKTVVLKHIPQHVDEDRLQAYLERSIFGVEGLNLVVPHPECCVAVASLHVGDDIKVSDLMDFYQTSALGNPFLRKHYLEFEMLCSPSGVYIENLPDDISFADITSFLGTIADMESIRHIHTKNSHFFAIRISDMCALHALITRKDLCIAGHIIKFQPYYPNIHDQILDYIESEKDKYQEAEEQVVCNQDKNVTESVRYTNQDDEKVEHDRDKSAESVKFTSNDSESVKEVVTLPDRAKDNDEEYIETLQDMAEVTSFQSETEGNHSATRSDSPNLGSDQSVLVRPLAIFFGPSFSKSYSSPTLLPTVQNIAEVKPFNIVVTDKDETNEEKERDQRKKTTEELWSETEDTIEPSCDVSDDESKLNEAAGGSKSVSLTGEEEAMFGEQNLENFGKLDDDGFGPFTEWSGRNSRYKGRQYHQQQNQQYRDLQGGLDEKAALKQAMLASQKVDRRDQMRRSRSDDQFDRKWLGIQRSSPDKQRSPPDKQRSSPDRQRSSPDRRSTRINGVTVHIQKGEIARHSAEVLVNVVHKSGQDPFITAIAKSFQTVGGPQLLQLYQMTLPTTQGRLVLATQSTGNLQCRTVLHVKLGKTLDCKETVDSAIRDILSECQKSGHMSVAIPPLGVGRMFGYPAPLVASRMLKQIYQYAVGAHRTSLKDITIVIYDSETFKTFTDALSEERWKQPGKPQRDQPSRSSYQNKRRPDDNSRRNALSYAPNDTSGITPGKSQSGSKECVQVRQSRKSDDYIQKMAFETDHQVPKYWNHYREDTPITQLLQGLKALIGNKHKKIELDQTTPVYKEIIKMMNETFDPKLVGKGRDASGIPEGSYKKLHVKKIVRIENLELYEKFALKRRNYFRKLLNSGEKRLPKIRDLTNSKGDPATSKYSKGVLGSDMHRKINEHLFFHGTKRKNVDIVCNGLDQRCGDHTAMLGQGIYGADSATKADQYTDSQDDRSFGQGNKKKMFLVRMLLGNPYVSSDSNPHKFKRPPCTKCYKDDCKTESHNRGKFGQFFDSVIGEGKLFREFVVYDGELCYPEYLITYERL